MMMSRELKLALILGFAAVMVVGVLLSDHMSGARKARIEERSMQSPQLALQAPTGGDYAPRTAPDAQVALVLPDADAGAPETVASHTPDAPETLEPPVTIAMGDPVDEQPAATLADASEGRSNALNDFLAWSERQGVRFENLGGATPLVETSARQTRTEPPATLPEQQPLVFGGGGTKHVVEEGETLWAIAERYYGDGAKYALIEEANKGRMGQGGALYVGAELTIPASGKAPVRQAADRTREQTPKRVETATAKPDRYHTVKKGETLGDIAKATLGSSKRWPEIVKLNPRDLADPDRVPVGARLKLPPQ